MTPAEYKARRLALGLTQDQLAAILNVQRETVVRRETGKQSIPEEAALAISAIAKPRP